MAKRYYWLKLKNDFFQSKEIKKLRTIAGGDTYTIIFLKMMLYSLESDGLIEYDEIEDTMAEEIALAIDERPDNVAVTLQYLLKKGLAQIVNEKDLFMTSVPELTGSEGASAGRMRELRDRKKALLSDGQASQCDTRVTEELHLGDVEIEKEKEIETESEKEKSKKVAKPPKHTYGEYQHVLLTDQEREKLFKAYGEYTTSECIRFLDEYIEEKGYKSKSHYLAIQRWVVNAVKEKSEKKQTGSGNPFLDAYRAMGGEL